MMAQIIQRDKPLMRNVAREDTTVIYLTDHGPDQIRLIVRAADGITAGCYLTRAQAGALQDALWTATL